METRIEGLNINYRIIGEGKPFLILHGWGSKSDRWEKVAEILGQKGFKVVIPDLPGFGQSDKPGKPWDLDNYVDFVEEFSKVLGLNKFILAGHSFGGGISVKYAVKNPEKIAELFLIASACIREDSSRKKFLRIISKIFKIFSFIPGVRKAFYKFIVRKSDYQYTDGIMKKTYLNIVGEDLSGLLSEIKVKTIIIWGDKDDVLPVEQSKEISDRIKGSKLVVISGADHDLEQKMPEVLTLKILENIC
jgi:pimeloyl-ACP methyl ester carboxylesterase